MHRPKVLGLVVLVLMMMTACPVYAGQTPSVTVDGVQVSFPDQIPYLVDPGRVMVPVAAPMMAMGCQVSWNGDTRQATITKEGTTAVFTIGSSNYTVNGESKTMDVAPEIAGNRTSFPIGYAALAMNATVTWNAASYTVIIQTGKNTETKPNNGMLSRTIDTKNDPMFEVGWYNPKAAGTAGTIIELASKNGQKYRWVCASHDEMNVYHTIVYSTGKETTYRVDERAKNRFSIEGGAAKYARYDMMPEPGMTLTYDIYNEQGDLVRTVDFVL